MLLWTPRANSLRPRKTIQVSINGGVVYPLESKPDTYYTLPSTVKWSGGKRESGAGRCTASLVFGPRSGGLRFGFTLVVVSVPWDLHAGTGETAHLLMLGRE